MAHGTFLRCSPDVPEDIALDQVIGHKCCSENQLAPFGYGPAALSAELIHKANYSENHAVDVSHRIERAAEKALDESRDDLLLVLSL